MVYICSGAFSWEMWFLRSSFRLNQRTREGSGTIFLVGFGIWEWLVEHISLRYVSSESNGRKAGSWTGWSWKVILLQRDFGQKSVLRNLCFFRKSWPSLRIINNSFSSLVHLGHVWPKKIRACKARAKDELGMTKLRSAQRSLKNSEFLTSCINH